MLEEWQETEGKQGEKEGLRGAEEVTAPKSIGGRLREFSQEGALPEGVWWLSAGETAAALRVSRRHVFALIHDGSFDCVIDLRGPGVTQAYWRIWRSSFLRFGLRARGEGCGRFRLEAELSAALTGQPATLTGQDLAAHFRCSKQHIYNLIEEWPNVGTSEAERALVRVSRGELLGLIRKRMIQGS